MRPADGDMKALITGADGFIGRHLIKRLIGMKDMQIFALSRNAAPSGSDGKRLVHVTGSILDGARMEALFRDNAFDAVIHLAAITAHDDIVNRRMETFDTNLKGTMNLLAGMNRYCRGALFLYASTGKVYGKTDQLPISEKAAVNPQNILGKSKRITEEVIDFCAQPYNRYLICRIFNVYGEGQKRSFVVPTIIDQLGRDEIALGNLTDRRDYLYIGDLCDALAACIEHRNGFSPVDYVNIGSGEGVSVGDMLALMEELLGRRLRVRVEEGRLRADETAEEYCDNGKLRSVTGWRPKMPLKEGLRRVLQDEGALK